MNTGAFDPLREPRAERIEEHRELARLSSTGRHLVAHLGGHWIPFDEPGLVVDAIREVCG